MGDPNTVAATLRRTAMHAGGYENEVMIDAAREIERLEAKVAELEGERARAVKFIAGPSWAAMNERRAALIGREHGGAGDAPLSDAEAAELECLQFVAGAVVDMGHPMPAAGEDKDWIAIVDVLKGRVAELERDGARWDRIERYFEADGRSVVIEVDGLDPVSFRPTSIRVIADVHGVAPTLREAIDRAMPGGDPS